MSTTAQWVFDKAIALMDELSESKGASDYSDTQEYKNRTLPILNVIRHECFTVSDQYGVPPDGEEWDYSRRLTCPEIMEWTAPIVGIDDAVAQGVMPYGLAAHLLLVEDTTAASFFNQRYQELLQAFRSAPAPGPTQMEDLYGGIEYGYMGRWG